MDPQTIIVSVILIVVIIVAILTIPVGIPSRSVWEYLWNRPQSIEGLLGYNLGEPYSGNCVVRRTPDEDFPFDSITVSTTPVKQLIYRIEATGELTEHSINFICQMLELKYGLLEIGHYGKWYGEGFRRILYTYKIAPKASLVYVDYKLEKLAKKEGRIQEQGLFHNTLEDL